MSERLCIDLFSGLGGFSAAFADADNWGVYRVELSEEFTADLHADVMDLQPSDLPDPDVVLAGHPCTLFSFAGNHDEWDGKTQTPVGERAKDHVAMAHHTVGLIKGLTPDFWFLENPRGRLRWVLGEPTGTVTYCQYGKPYQKRTDLWGKHPWPMEYRTCSPGERCHERNVEHDGTSATASMSNDVAERSKVPYQLSVAIRDAVELAYSSQGPEYETSTLGDW